MKEFRWTGKSGEFRITAEYKETMEKKIVNADGIKIEAGEEKHETAMMVLYLNGEKIDTCRNAAFWKLIDTKGVKKIWGLKTGFADEETAAAYEAFVAEVIAEGQIEETEEAIETAEEITAEEAELRQAWINTVNEGGEGYVPNFKAPEKKVTDEQINEAVKEYNAGVKADLYPAIYYNKETHTLWVTQYADVNSYGVTVPEVVELSQCCRGSYWHGVTRANLRDVIDRIDRGEEVY